MKHILLLLLATLPLSAPSNPDICHKPSPSLFTPPFSPARTCRLLPSDPSWPTPAVWNSLNTTVSGNLVRPLPLASVCHGNNYSSSLCAAITSGWSDSSVHISHATSIMSVLFEGLSCLPTGPSCVAGGYPVYVVNAHATSHIQAAVTFARTHNVRLVIKNTGHDFLGKSAGAGALSVRTHHLKHLRFIDNYTQAGGGPAIRVGAGVEMHELYAFAHAHGVVAVGGEGKTVGFSGGYVLGGGHSPLSSVYGMAADHVLAFEVVLASGALVTARPDPGENAELFWALAGGGGSTFGVVVATTVRVYPDLAVTVAEWTFGPSWRDVHAEGGANDDFWNVVRMYHTFFPDHADRGVYSYYNIFGGSTPTFSMNPFFAPRHSVAEVSALISPLVSYAASLNISITPTVTAHAGFHSAWLAGFPKERVGMWNGQLGSRLFPRANWQSSSSPGFSAMFSAIRAQVSKDSSFLIAFNISPRLSSPSTNNSINPAWRHTLMHAITGTLWPADLTNRTTIDALRHTFTHRDMQAWRDVSTGSGSYLNEADINEPQRQQAFWGGGERYEMLYKIKQRVDPRGVFFAETAVGSEDWTTGRGRVGRLCKV